MANLFVDEARLSPNFFKYGDDEARHMISNYDPKLVEVVGKGGETTLVELYLFK